MRLVDTTHWTITKRFISALLGEGSQPETKLDHSLPLHRGPCKVQRQFVHGSDTSTNNKNKFNKGRTSWKHFVRTLPREPELNSRKKNGQEQPESLTLERLKADQTKEKCLRKDWKKMERPVEKQKRRKDSLPTLPSSKNYEDFEL